MTDFISIIIATSGKTTNLSYCLGVLKEYIPHPNFELIVTGDCPNLPDGIIMQRGSFRGLAEAFNAGAAKAKGSLLLFLHDDVLLPPEALAILTEELQKAPHAAAIGPFSNRSRNLSFQVLSNLPYRTYEEMLQFSRQMAAQKHQCHSSIWLDNFCLLIRKEAFQSVGGFDENFPSHYTEDMDLSLRLLDKGWSLIVSPRAYVHHEPKNVRPQDAENLSLFQERWHFSPEYSLNARNDLLPWLTGLSDEPAILEIGCACGPTLLKARDLFPKARLYGVELAPGPARIASHFAEVSAYDIEELSRPDWQETFDCIICGDVIEHLLRPKKALENIYHYLKPGGRLLLGLPNIMHISIFECLLNGRFPYADSGILDRTHTKFFTKTEIMTLLEETQFHIEDFNSLVVPMTPHEQELFQKLTPLLSPNTSPEELKSYQMHIKAVKQ